MVLFRRRGGKRLIRFGRRRCPLFLFSLSLFLLGYLAFFGANFPFIGLHGGQVMEGTSTVETVKSRWKYADDHLAGQTKVSQFTAENDFLSSIPLPKFEGRFSHNGTDGDTTNMENMTSNRRAIHMREPQKSKSSRKRYGPCEVDFKKTVDDLVEPDSYMNYANFSLSYVSKEENPSGNVLFEPRFGGHQTLEQRENSYYARNQIVHCGFVKGPEGYRSSGFDLNEIDREYMAICRVVVSSCIFGSSDFLRRPTRKMISTFSKNNVCFVMFVDELTLTKLSSEGQVPDDKGYIGLWRVVVVKNLPYIDMRRTGKVPKFLSHRLFPSARYSIWIDSKMRLQTDPILILEYFLWRKRAEYAISNHYARHCVWEEVLQNKRLNKYNHTAIDEQFRFYQSDGLIKFNESDKNAPLPSYVPEGSFIVRAHTPMSNLFSCLWFNEVNWFTSRDQLSFAYTFLKLRRMNPEKRFFFNMFKDCERRAIAKLFHHRAEVEQLPLRT